jgi:hypothetical protein
MIDSAKLLAGIPACLRDPLIASLQEIAANYAEHRWEPAELNGGKLCEVAFTIIDGTLKGAFAATPSKPANMVDACRLLEKIQPSASRVGDRSLRILIPRILTALYEIRNNRNVGHVGSDVDPNYLDATVVLSMSSWVVAELVRVFHNVPTQEAQESVDALIERKLPVIWEVGPVRRVLDSGMQARDQVLLLLYQKPGWVSEKDLASWVEYSSLGMFRTRVLRPLHTARFIEHDNHSGTARISPKGAREVEERVLRSRKFKGFVGRGSRETFLHRIASIPERLKM